MFARAFLFSAGVLVAQGLNAQPANDTLAKIRQSGAVTIGHRESSVPFSFVDDQQQPVGFSMDLCARIIAKIRTSLGMPNLKVNYQPVTASNRIPLLQNGTIDMECGSTTNSLKRQKVVSFLLTTFVAGTKILVKSNSKATGLRDLKDQVVVLSSGTNNISAVQAFDKENSLGLKYLYGKDHGESFAMLETDRAQGFATDDILLYSLRANARDPKQYKVVGDFLSEEPYGIMIRKDDAAFKALSDEALRKLFKDGTYEQLYKKWFLSPIPPRRVNLDLPMSDKVRDLFANPNDRGV
jgi:glutamate/aspartate transport system substrate-binding protein